MLSRFCRYIDKVFDFGSFLSGVADSRRKPQIETRSAFLSAFVMFAAGRRSLNAMEAELRMPKRLDGLIGKRKPGADSIGRIASATDSGPLRDMLCAFNRRIKRNKVLQTDWPLRFAAVDGHEFFSLTTPPLRGLPRADDQDKEGQLPRVLPRRRGLPFDRP